MNALDNTHDWTYVYTYTINCIEFSMNSQCTVGQRRWQCTWNSKVAADGFCLHFSFVLAKWVDQLQLYSNCTRSKCPHSLNRIHNNPSSRQGRESGYKGALNVGSSGLHAEQQHLRTGIWWETLHRFGFFSLFLATKRNKNFRFQIQKRFSLRAELSSSECWMRMLNANATRGRRDSI